MDCIWIFLVVWKWTFFARFSLSGSRCMSDAITSAKLEPTGNIFWDSRCCLCFVCMGICVLNPAHESEMSSYLVYVLIVKKRISLILFKFSHSILDWTVLSRNFFGIFWNIFLEGSVDLIIYRDCIVNQRFFAYCSLATGIVSTASGSTGARWHRAAELRSPLQLSERW